MKVFSCEETIKLVVESVPDAEMETESSGGREEEVIRNPAP
jgi:hypothetical protein